MLFCVTPIARAGRAPVKPVAADRQQHHANRQREPEEPPCRISHRVILRRREAPHNKKLVWLGEVGNRAR